MILWRLRRIARGLLFLLLLGLLGLAAQAQTDISQSPDTQSWGPRVTIDPSGNVHAVWLEAYSSTSGDIFYSRLSKSGGSWTSPQNISQSEKACSNINESYHVADIDHDASGNIYVVWAEHSAVMLRTFSGGSWGSIFTVASTSGLDGPIISADPSGNLFIVWWSGYRIWTRSRINGQWEGSRQLSVGTVACKYPGIGAGANDVYAVWMQKTSNDYRVFWSRRNKTLNAGWATPGMIYNGAYPQEYPCVKVDAAEGVHVVYLDELAEGVRTAKYSMKSGSGFTTPISISATSGLHYPSMSVQSTNVYAQWQCGGWGNGLAIRYNFKLSGEWTGESSVPGSKGTTYGDLEADPDGKVNFVWDSNGSNGDIYYYLLGGSGPPPPPPPPPPPAENKPPVARFTFSPSSGWAPQEVEFDGGSSSDPDGSVVDWSWQFGDGGQESGAHVFHTYYNQGTYSIRLTVTDNGGKTDSLVKSIKISGIFPPKNIQWVYNVDQSLFSQRWVAKVTWEANSQNASAGISVDHYNVYRQETGGDNDAWKIIKSVSAGGTLQYMDTDVQSQGQYRYGVTAVDTAGHTSILATSGTGDNSAMSQVTGARPNVRRPVKY